MKNAVSGAIGFILGTALGGFVVWRLIDDKYKAYADEEIESVKSVFTVPKTEKMEVKKETIENPNLLEAAKEIAKPYTKYSTTTDGDTTIQYPWDKKHSISVISPDDFGEDNEYEQISLTMYADGIVADEDDEVINNPAALIGDALEHIGEYEDDAVHVKNDMRKSYYEILVDSKSYEAATGKKLPQDKED